MARGLIISYAGYPYTPSSLLADNGLANLAGALLANGHDVRIIDFGSVDVVRRLMPPDVHARLSKAYLKAKHLKEQNKLNIFHKLCLLNEFKKADRVLSRFQETQVSVIGRELIELIREEKYDFVGFKLWLGDGFAGSVTIANAIKREYPGIKIFAGGPIVDEGEEAVLEIAPVFDAAVYSDGEEAIVDLALYCDGNKALKDVHNIIYRQDNRIIKTEPSLCDDINNLPLPVYDEKIYPSMSGNSKMKIAVLDESRGCPNRCYFCPHVHKSGGKWRVKSPDRIIQEIKRLIEIYNIHAFRYAGSCTPADTMRSVAKRILDEGIDVVYTSFASANISDTDSFKMLKKSGLQALFFGVESGDDRILHEVMNKKMLSAELIRKSISSAIDAGIFCVGSLIFPAPGETPQSRQTTIDLLKDIYKRPGTGAIEVQFPGLFPGTEWYENAERFGFRIKNPDTYKRDMATYKIKLLFPPSYWKPVPYSVDGKPFKVFARETERFVQELEKDNILSMVTDEMALAAQLLGISAREYRDRTRFQFVTGDWEGLERDASTINSAISHKGSSKRLEIREKQLL